MAIWRPSADIRPILGNTEAVISTDILVLGAGLIGVSTAYELARRGARVTLVDRQPEPAQETSFANGGQLSACEVAPWAGPEVPGMIFNWLGSADTPLRVVPKASLEQWRWLYRFWRRCSTEARMERFPHNLALALYARARMDAIQQELHTEGKALAFNEERLGILRIFREAEDFDAAANEAAQWADYGLNQRILSPGECQRLEPTLKNACANGDVTGGIHSPDDRSGDAAAYTKGLAKAAEHLGVRFIGNVHVDRLIAERGRIVAVSAGEHQFEPNHVVVAAATGSRALLSPLGLKIPIYPVKGYSVTMPANEGAPRVSISDEEHKVVMSRLGNTLRAAGKADIVGYDNAVVDVRARSVLRAVVQLFPRASAGAARAQFWAGLRPMTPDGSPVIDRSQSHANLWLNTGHGTLGWTLAAGSGALLAAMMAGEERAIDETAFSLQRFG